MKYAIEISIVSAIIFVIGGLTPMVHYFIKGF